MIDASLPLQAAVVAALKSSAELTPLIAGRVYDRVPVNPKGTGTAYITLGSGQSIDDSDACHALVECYLQVDCWSEAVGYPEVKRIGAAAVKALNAPLAVEGFAVTIHRVESLSYQREADNLTSRAIIRLRYDLQAIA